MRDDKDPWGDETDRFLAGLTQTERIKWWMKHWKRTLTPMEAWHYLGIYRTSAAVFKINQELRDKKSMYRLVDIGGVGPNRFGEQCRFATYSPQQLGDDALREDLEKHRPDLVKFFFEPSDGAASSA